MSYDLPGPGDSATWGPIRGKNDPRYNDPEPAACASMLVYLNLAKEALERAIRAAENETLAEAKRQTWGAIDNLKDALV